MATRWGRPRFTGIRKTLNLSVSTSTLVPILTCPVGYRYKVVWFSKYSTTASISQIVAIIGGEIVNLHGQTTGEHKLCEVELNPGDSIQAVGSGNVGDTAIVHGLLFYSEQTPPVDEVSGRRYLPL